MEALLSLSFDNLSSYDITKIRKGLRQVEGLLAQICLSQRRPDKRRSLLSPSKPTFSNTTTPSSSSSEESLRKELADLPADPAFREFFKLQEGFEWNVALRLVSTLDRLMGKSNDGQHDLLIIATLDLIQGILLLHPPSRTLFGREVYMNHLLDLLEPINCPQIQSATLLTLVVALLDAPQNTRTFEALDGLLTVTSLFRKPNTSQEVKLKLIEFLYFYLLPETPTLPAARDSLSIPQPMRKRASSQVERPGTRDGRPGTRGGRPSTSNGNDKTRTIDQKQLMLQKYLPNVEDLVADLKESAPFGSVYA